MSGPLMKRRLDFSKNRDFRHITRSCGMRYQDRIEADIK